MLQSIDVWLIIAASLVFVAVLFSKASKLGLPILILFIALGMIAGSEGIGGIDFENYELSYTISIIALCLILFSGAIETNVKDIKPIIGRGLSLANIGVLLTAGLVCLFSHYFIGITWEKSLLLGAVLSSTDAAAVFNIFKSLNLHISKKVKSVIEFESGSNDPMAYFLVVLLSSTFIFSPLEGIGQFIWSMMIGAIGGYLFSKMFIFFVSKVTLGFPGLYMTLTISTLFLTYSVTNYLNGNGFLAVYILGLMLSSSRFPHKRASLNFIDGTSWLMQIGLFILLGVLVFPSRLYMASSKGIFIAIFLIFVARPLSVFISLAFSSFNFKEKLFISWAGLKGAVPIVFACLVAVKKGQAAYFLFDIVFFVVLVSALTQGWTLKPMAKILGLTESPLPETLPEIDDVSLIRDSYKIVTIHIDHYAVGKNVFELRLPSGTLIVCIKRAGKYFTPHGATILEELDECHILCLNSDDLELVNRIFTVGVPENKLANG